MMECRVRVASGCSVALLYMKKLKQLRFHSTVQLFYDFELISEWKVSIKILHVLFPVHIFGYIGYRRNKRFLVKRILIASSEY